MKKEFAKLIEWSLATFHQLPWRLGRTPYSTLVSEMMLQQTTVSTVKTRLPQFLKKFPTIEALARASEQDVLHAWEGLGYYRRARLLKAAAEHISQQHGRQIPSDIETLESIPGIGRYTASALRSIGHDLPALSLDANLERVLARVLNSQTPRGPKLHKEIQEQFQDGKLAALKNFSPRDLNEALMDLGREICKSREALCRQCPLQKICMATKHGDPLTMPHEDKIKKQKRTQKFNIELVRIIVEKDGKYLAAKRTKGQWLEGQWELPTFVLSTSKDLKEQYADAHGKLKSLAAEAPQFKSTITSHIFSNHVAELTSAQWRALGADKKDQNQNFEWHQGPWSSASKKALAMWAKSNAKIKKPKKLKEEG